MFCYCPEESLSTCLHPKWVSSDWGSERPVNDELKLESSRLQVIQEPRTPRSTHVLFFFNHAISFILLYWNLKISLLVC